MSFRNGDRVKHVDGWNGSVLMVMPEIPGEEITVRVMRTNIGQEVDVPASELMMNMPGSNNFANTRRNNIPQIGGRKRKSHRRRRRHSRK